MYFDAFRMGWCMHVASNMHTPLENACMHHIHAHTPLEKGEDSENLLVFLREILYEKLEPTTARKHNVLRHI